MKNIITIFLFLFSPVPCLSQSDTTVILCDLASTVSVYADSIGTTNKIGEITHNIFLIAPGGDTRYLVYGNGVIGYAWSGNIIASKYEVRKLQYGNINWKIEHAKYLEAQLIATRAKQKQIDSIALVEEALQYVTELEKKRSKGIYINSFYTIKDDYWGGCGFQITNYSKITIKYLYLTVKALNPVDDLIGTKIITAVGPIEIEHTGNYEFKDIFLTRVLGKVKLLKLVIEYKNGLKKEYTGAGLKNITDTETEN